MIFKGAGLLIYYVNKDKSIDVFLGIRNINPFKGYWSIMGGKSNYRESSIKTAKREFSEEVLFTKKFLKNKRFLTCHTNLSNSLVFGPFFQFDTIFARSSIKFNRSDIRFIREFFMVRWMPLEIALKINYLHPGLKNSLKKLEKYSKERV